MRLVLDTHVLVWLMIGERSLPPDAIKAIEDARKTDDVFIPVICFWELGMLHSRAKVQLGKPPMAWARDVLNKPGIALADLTVTTAIESTCLPGELHRDPTDRIIIATTRALDGTLVTHDRAILRYAEQGHVRVLAA